MSSLLPIAAAAAAPLDPARCISSSSCKTWLTDPQLATDFRNRDTGLRLLQRKHDLRFGELGFFHGNRQAPILS